ncbi:hypothetical protein EJ04DRAFT_516103 [Polyplosphaeria fusca]|uniref:L-ornithine N(5)-monooxygenase [NAD(P)H] n=1 Tax=Polyplosphaeria fusca TaxID=682080 RepID=A0A9P4QQQ2_9PLEO|nr:hypothetical protein EJ04DRAFT_516103 [Polyplosphaeria fusca]
MENPFAFDLVTTRNPRSSFTYVNYLLAHDRLVEFANSDRLNPLRLEFEQYLEWCAEQFRGQVRYQNEVIGVFPERAAECVRSWNIAVKDEEGKTYMVRTRNILVPAPSHSIPPKPQPLFNVNFAAGQRIISVDEYLSRRDELSVLREPRLNVTLVGSSERTVEVLEDLLCCYKLGNIAVITDNESLRPLRILDESTAPPPPRLCSIWSRPSGDAKPSVPDASERIQHIYSRAYDKQVASNGKYRLSMAGKDGQPPADASIIIVERLSTQPSSSGLFQGLDSLVLGCRQKGECLNEVQFKRGAVAEGCNMWMMSARSEGGRSLARDIAVRAGEVVRALSAAKEDGEAAVVINARM